MVQRTPDFRNVYAPGSEMGLNLCATLQSRGTHKLHIQMARFKERKKDAYCAGKWEKAAIENGNITQLRKATEFIPELRKKYEEENSMRMGLSFDLSI